MCPFRKTARGVQMDSMGMVARRRMISSGNSASTSVMTVGIMGLASTTMTAYHAADCSNHQTAAIMLLWSTKTKNCLDKNRIFSVKFRPVETWKRRNSPPYTSVRSRKYMIVLTGQADSFGNKIVKCRCTRVLAKVRSPQKIGHLDVHRPSQEEMTLESNLPRRGSTRLYRRSWDSSRAVDYSK